MKHTIENNSAETITVVTDEHRLCITQRFKSLPGGFNQYKTMIMNRDEVRRLAPIMNQWLNGGLK
jgi:hypothetical protein